MKHIPDKLWCEINFIIPQKKTLVGRPEVDNRKVLDGVVFVLHSGIKWKLLPDKYGNYKTVHRKYINWARTGVFEKMMTNAREYYRRRNSKNNWYAFDTISKKAPLARFSGKNPTDRSKRGIKHSIMVDRKGAPIYVDVAAANIHDSLLLKPIICKMRKSKQTRIIAADSAFDVQKLRSLCKDKNIALIASPNSRRKQGAHKFNAPFRWIVEQTFGILAWLRGLKICWAKTKESALAFLQIASSLRLFKMAGILR